MEEKIIYEGVLALLEKAERIVAEAAEQSKANDAMLTAKLAADTEQSRVYAAEATERSKAYVAEAAERSKIYAAEAAERARMLDARFAETDRIVQNISKDIGGISNNNGDFAEEYFINALEEKKVFAGQKFDEFRKNMKAKAGALEDEFDIVMYNGFAVAIIEVKYKVRKDYLEKMVEKKVPAFRALFPYYKDFKIYLGIGSMSFHDDVLEKAKELGIGILKQKGETIEMYCDHIKEY
jgi:hypothetical protein